MANVGNEIYVVSSEVKFCKSEVEVEVEVENERVRLLEESICYICIAYTDKATIFVMI